MIEYVGRNKDQDPYPTCATHALTAFLTQHHYRVYGEVKEFDVNNINPNNEAIGLELLIDKLRKDGIAEEGKDNASEYVVNLKVDRLEYIEEVLECEDLILASITGADPLNPSMGHLMLYLGAEYVSPSIYDVYFHNSLGYGTYIMRGQPLGGLIALNDFYRVTFKEKYYRKLVEVQPDSITIPNTYDMTKPILLKQVVDGENHYATYTPIRPTTESMGDNVTWIQGNGENNKVLQTSKAREV